MIIMIIIIIIMIIITIIIILASEYDQMRLTTITTCNDYSKVY